MIEQTEVDIRRFDQSTFAATRALDAQALGPPQPPAHVVPPGAKAAIPHDRLVALQQAGHDERAIVERQNARWEQQNAERLEEHKRWIAGPYVDAIRQMREAAAHEHGEQLRREAALERWMREHEEG